MKNYLVVVMILITGLTAYPQATRSARETKSEKSSAKKENVQRSESKADRKSGSERKVTVRSQEKSRSENQPSSVQRSRTVTERPQDKRSNEATRSKVETRTTDRKPVTRSNSGVTRGNSEVRRPQEATKSRTTTEKRGETINSGRRTEAGNVEKRGESGNAVRRNETVNTERKSGDGDNQNREVRDRGNSNDREVKVNTSSASRVYREGKGTLTRDDGTVIRHQNDEVFTSRRYKLDYDNYENLRRSDDFRRDYRDYDDWNHRRRIRVVNHYHNNYVIVPWEVRRHRYYYRVPHHVSLIWTPLLFHRFMYYYPTHNNWDMEFGREIETISAYESEQYAGAVRRVYGKVDEVFYSPEDENYILYIGAPFPYHDISIVIPKYIARDISRSPKWYFEDEYIWVVGLINMWEGKPEIVVRDEDQIRKY